MVNDLPMTDWAAMARWLGAFALVFVLPGWLLVGRHARGLDGLSRFYLAAAGGLLVTTLISLGLSAVRLPSTPATTLLASLALALGLGFNRRWRRTAAGLADQLGRLGGREALLVVVLCAGQAAIMLAAFRGYAAPNSIDDASNHAFLVTRVLAEHSLVASRVFAPPYGLPAVPYLSGWHGDAALLAELGRVPAWISTWYLPAWACVLTPLALSLLWRACGLARGAILLGVAFAVANYHQPLNIFSWGGFGAIIGLSLAPFVVLALRAAVRASSAAAGVMAGLGLVAMLHIHASEVFTAILLLFCVWPRRDESSGARRKLGRALVWGGAVFVVAGVLPLWQQARVYGGWTAAEALAPSPGWRASLHHFLVFAGGNVPSLRWFVGPGLLAGFLSRRTRRLAWLSLAFLLLYLGLRQVHDPISLVLSRPYYRQYPRLVYPQMFLLPPLMATAVLGVLAWLGRQWRWRGRRWGAVLALGALAYWVLYPGAYWSYRNLEAQGRLVPFSAADARLARDMARELPGDALVANQYGDGSYWAMHISRLRFLDPCGWPLGQREGLHHRPAIARFLERPWPPEVLGLRNLGTGYIYVSDAAQEGVKLPLSRERLDAEPRFRRLLDNGNAAVYRILWDAESAADESQ